MKRLAYLILCSPLLVSACEVSKSENPLSPSLAGPIPGVEITAPKLLEPGNGAQIAPNQQPLTLLLENASSTSVRPLNYVFEVATDAGFGNKVFSREGIQPGDNGRTSLRLQDALGTGKTYYWRAKAQDGANTGPYSAAVSFNVFTPVSFDKPFPVSPSGNSTITNLAPEFRFNNAPHAGSPDSITYVIEVSTSDSFVSPVAWSVAEQPGADTKLNAPSGLLASTQYFWRVRAHDSGTVGPWSDVAAFRTYTPVVVAPTPGPTTPAPGGSCSAQASPELVVKCRRAQYGYMNSSQVLQFLKAVAHDLNIGGYSNGPYGILEKTSGNNCGGFSCDIICNTRGDLWDTLADSEGSQDPIWLPKGSSSSRCVVQ